MSNNAVHNILNYYEEIESYLAPALLYPNQYRQGAYCFQKINSETKEIIQHNEDFQDPTTYIHRLYIGVVDFKTIYKKLTNDKNIEVNNGNKVSYLISYEVDSIGDLILDSLHIPQYIINMWHDVKNLPHESMYNSKLVMNLKQKIEAKNANEWTVSFASNMNAIHYLLDIVLQEMKVFKKSELKDYAYIESVDSINYKRIKKSKPQVFPSIMPNSFFIDDIKRIQSKDEFIKGTALHQYLSDPKDMKRMDVSNNINNIKNCMNSINMTTAAWPKKDLFPLVTAQQLAVNNFFNFYFDKNRSGLYSTNGPPGSGKTTMMQDIIANIITRRSKQLNNNESVFIDKMNIVVNGKQKVVYIPNDNITGYEIVVASSNNTAVENITKELSLYQKSDEQIIGDFTYFPQNNYSWGCVSACLGNNYNNKSFIKDLSGHSGSILQQIKNSTQKEEVKNTNFLDTQLKMLMEFAQKGTIGKLPNQEAIDLVNGIKTTNDYWKKDLNIIHKESPLNSRKFNSGKARLLLSALKNHKNMIINNKEQFINNLQLFEDVLNKKITSYKAIKAIWQSLFLVIPVISTTYASFSRLFGDLKGSDIGVLISDESGQAMPHVAIGALWRTKCAMIVGDPMQIVPVVPFDENIDNYLARKHNVDPQYRTSMSSLQEVADLANPYGSIIDIREEQKWIGSPLRVHRRCAEPMFSLANSIAYDDTMIYATTDNKEHKIESIIGESQWFDITETGKTIKHFNEDEYDFLKFQLKRIMYSGMIDEFPSIYVISPFTSVISEIQQRLIDENDWTGHSILSDQKLKEAFIKQNFGTVHKFQGKEADTVFMVLGGQKENEKAVDWATKDPNIPNVALTRAKQSFYVIGNKNLWYRKMFIKIADKLTVI